MLNDEEVDALINDVLHKYGYDFLNYSSASLKRRINRLYTMDNFSTFSELRFRLNNDPGYLKKFVEEITVNVTEMFRDPWFYQSLRTQILPVLATKPFIRIWHAGCSTGEEVYSMAIILKEAGLLEKSLLYATDLNPEVLEKGKKGLLPLNAMKQYSQNYHASGGQADFSSYYTANYGQVKINNELISKIIFSTHNLVSDSSFNSFDLIVCRNVLIYFNKNLQERVFQLFDDSMEVDGYLALGSKESIRFSRLERTYQQVGTEKIWRKSK